MTLDSWNYFQDREDEFAANSAAPDRPMFTAGPFHAYVDSACHTVFCIRPPWASPVWGMRLAQDITAVLDRHVPVEAVETAPRETRALIKETQDLRVEIIELVETLDDALKERQRLGSQST